jgi:hypothetical protein
MTLGPDTKPEPLDAFKVSKRAASEQKVNVQMQLDALDSRIQTIVDKVIIKDVPILHPILGMTHEREELELLGRALPRVAELVQQRDKLAKQSAFLDLLIDEPEVVAMLAGDFIDEFDTDSFDLKE